MDGAIDGIEVNLKLQCSVRQRAGGESKERWIGLSAMARGEVERR